MTSKEGFSGFSPLCLQTDPQKLSANGDEHDPQNVITSRIPTSPDHQVTIDIILKWFF